MQLQFYIHTSYRQYRIVIEKCSLLPKYISHYFNFSCSWDKKISNFTTHIYVDTSKKNPFTLKAKPNHLREVVGHPPPLFLKQIGQTHFPLCGTCYLHKVFHKEPVTFPALLVLIHTPQSRGVIIR